MLADKEFCRTPDRSVGQIDYAIRRRFAFIDMLPRVLSDKDLPTDKIFANDLFEKVSRLFIKNSHDYIEGKTLSIEKSDYLSEEFRPEDVWLGHSYFIIKKDDENHKKVRLKHEIIPILKEYLKDGIFKTNFIAENTQETAENIINRLLDK
jgi:hypothetical protein